MPDNRHDYGRPARDRFGLPGTQFPTPNVEDLIIVETVDMGPNYAPLLRGTPHPRVTTALLVSDDPKAGDNIKRVVRRIYATPRAAQDAYNAARKFVADSASAPVYIRSYVLQRPWTPGARNAPLTSLIGITLTAGGSGYVAAPLVSFTGGAGSGAEALVVMNGGEVVAVWLTDGGTGFTSAPTVVFTPAGDTAAASATITDRGVSSITAISGGTGYDTFANPQPAVNITGGGGTGATAIVSAYSGDQIAQITVTNPGTGYVSVPDVDISGGGGAGATAGAVIDAFSLVSIQVDDGGTNYATAPTVTIVDTDLNGAGAAATAHVTGGRVTSITLTAPGSGFTGAVLISFSGGRSGSGAAATALLQPTTAVLVHEEGAPVQGELGSLFDQVSRVYSTQPGPIIHERKSYAGGMVLDTTRQAVAPGTLPSAATGTILGTSVRQSSTTEAEEVKTTLLNSDLTAATGFPIVQTQRKDEKTGITIFTDSFIAQAGYTLPNTYVGGTAAQIASNYPTWKQPNATPGTGYGSSEYSPKVHYVIDAKSRSVSEENSQLLVTIDHGRIPPSRVEDDENYAFTFPALFAFNQTRYSVPRNYGGQYRPPWPIGKDQIGGFERKAARPGKWPARKFITYSLGPREDLPPEYSVVTPGTASKFFNIPERCIHTPILIEEQLDNGTIQPIEDIPASTPSSYDPKDILIARAVERRIWGEIYEQTVVLISEETPLSKFPDPAVDGYYRSFQNFRATSTTVFPANALNGRQVIVSTTGAGSETASLQIFGRTSPGQAVVSASESISAAPSPAASAKAYLSIREVFLAAPLLTDSVIIREAVLPSAASLQVIGTPQDGDLMDIRLTASIYQGGYQFRTALTSDAVYFLTVSNAGTGYTNPTVTFTGGGGSGATATLTVSGGALAEYRITNPGTSYETAPTVTINPGGTQATATVTLSGSGISTSFTVTNAGTEYTSAPTVSFTPNGVVATAHSVLTADAVSSFVMDNTGTEYSVPPTVVLSGGGGTGAAGTAHLTGNSITSITVNTGGSGYTSAPAVTLTGGQGSGATATATVGGGVVTGISRTAAGSNYVVAPLVTLAGGRGSGAVVTATLGQANQILISSNHFAQAVAIVEAIRGVGLGTYAGLLTAANSDVTASRDTSAPDTVLFSSTDALSAPDSASWTFNITHAGSPATWGTLSDFVGGDDGQILCAILAGSQFAFNGGRDGSGRTINSVTFVNGTLLDEAVDNDVSAGPNCPAAVVLYSDWQLLPSGLPIRIRFGAAGGPIMLFAYQLSSNGSAPATTPVAGVGVVTGAKTLTGTSLSAYIGCAVLIPGDTIENEVIAGPSLRRAYGGSTGTVTVAATPLVATTLAYASGGHPRGIDIGTPGAQYVRLKITQVATPYRFRAIHADAAWTISPDL